MKLGELIHIIDEGVFITVNGKKYTKEVSKEILGLEVVRINIETSKIKKEGLEELGYSFEVGV